MLSNIFNVIFGNFRFFRTAQGVTPVNPTDIAIKSYVDTVGLQDIDSVLAQGNTTTKTVNLGSIKLTGNSVAKDHLNTSDRRLKTDIKDFDSEISIQDIKLRSYKRDGKEEWGVIAQELREVMPHAVYGDEEKEMLTVSNNQLLVLLIKRVQELENKVADLT